MQKSCYLAVNTHRGDDAFRVYWCTEEEFGVVKITTTDDRPRKIDTAIAEITGLHHLLTELQVAGRDRTGKDLTLELSRGAIRKALVGRKRANPELRGHLHWLRTQFSDATFSVPKRNRADAKTICDALMRGTDFDGRTMLVSDSVEFPTAPLIVPIRSPDIGRIIISEHAVQQFQKRNNMESSSKAWRKIRNMLANEKLIPSNISNAVLEQKRKKWADRRARFFNCSRSWQLVLVPSNGRLGENCWTLATLYQRYDISID